MLHELLAPQRGLEAVAAALNKLIARDPGLQAGLKPLLGRSLDVRIARLGWRVCVAVEADGLVLATSSLRAADVVLEGSLGDLLAMGRARQRGESVPAGRVRLEGDLAVVQQVQEVMDGLVLDWEGFLTQYVGPLAARQIARVIVGLGEFLRTLHQSLERDLAEYLRTETGLLPAAPEVEAFQVAVMQLATDVDRLVARVRRLEARGTAR